ncbi:MAG TPA: DUF1684 domain-containing protein [Thermoanaerobaculia bacterium]|nr:DUF1684 domain-containing protein [Thermoanaerobaculia bacterium]
MKRFFCLVAFLVACGPEAALDPAVHQAEVEKWQKNRDERLRREDGWLTLVGLHWLEPGPNTIGSAPGNAITLPENAPPQLGTLTLADGNVTFEPAEESGVTIDERPVQDRVGLRDDHDNGGPTLVHAGTLNFQIIQRGDRHAVRVKDPQAETLVHFEGLEYFPIDPRWRVVAQFEPYQPARRIPIDDVTGFISDQEVPGALVFEVDGEKHRLDAIDDGSRELFVIFRDATSRDATYPAGRYLYVSRPGVDGKVVVDFNKAYSPPCVFTPFATCPLPPPQNRLPFRIEAGEKNYKKTATG